MERQGTGNGQSPEENAVVFFRHVKRDLGISSTRKIVDLVGRVIYHLRSGMSSRQSLAFLNGLPGLFQLLFIRHWKGAEGANGQRSNAHLDELVDSIYTEDKTSNRSTFGSEVEAMSAVVVILKKFDRQLNLFSTALFNYPLVDELRQVYTEEIL